jgi:hypothetical protein
MLLAVATGRRQKKVANESLILPITVNGMFGADNRTKHQ